MGLLLGTIVGVLPGVMAGGVGTAVGDGVGTAVGDGAGSVGCTGAGSADCTGVGSVDKTTGGFSGFVGFDTAGSSLGDSVVCKGVGATPGIGDTVGVIGCFSAASSIASCCRKSIMYKYAL